MNSRPLIAFHNGVDDRLALSPADFLIGRSIVAVPEPRERTLPTNRTHHWRSIFNCFGIVGMTSISSHCNNGRNGADQLRIYRLAMSSSWDTNIFHHPNGDLAALLRYRSRSKRRCRIMRDRKPRDGNYKRMQTTRAAQKVCRLFSDDPGPTGPAGQEMYNNVASS